MVSSNPSLTTSDMLSEAIKALLLVVKSSTMWITVEASMATTMEFSPALGEAKVTTIVRAATGRLMAMIPIATTMKPFQAR